MRVFPGSPTAAMRTRSVALTERRACRRTLPTFLDGFRVTVFSPASAQRIVLRASVRLLRPSLRFVLLDTVSVAAPRIASVHDTLTRRPRFANRAFDVLASFASENVGAGGLP